MEKKFVYVLAVLVLLLLGGGAYLYVSLGQQKKVNQEMQELAELDKLEMEKEYEQFAMQYSEMKTQINNDSIVAQLTQEQLKTQKLLEELKNLKASDAREIARLKKELATVRAALRNFVIQIDSLNRENTNLKRENSEVRGQLAETTRQVEGLNQEKQTLSQKVAIAAQLDATNIRLTPLKKNNKEVRKIKDAKTLAVGFTISRNVTAQTGMKTFYIVITTPTNSTLTGGGKFTYENTTLDCSMQRIVEYNGEETNAMAYWNVTEFLSAGVYTVSIFCDGNLIGEKSFTLK